MAVDVGRGPCRRGYLGERHVLTAESAPLVVKVVQNVPPRVAGACYISGSANGAVGRIYSVPNPRATPQTQKPPLLLNPILAKQGAYPLLRLDERRWELEEKGLISSTSVPATRASRRTRGSARPSKRASPRSADTRARRASRGSARPSAAGWNAATGSRSTPRARSCRPRAPRRPSSTLPWPSCTTRTSGAASPTARQATPSTNGDACSPAARPCPWS